MSSYTVASAVRKTMDFNRHIASAYSRPFDKSSRKPGKKRLKLKKVRLSKSRVREGRRRLKYEQRQKFLRSFIYFVRGGLFCGLLLFLLEMNWPGRGIELMLKCFEYTAGILGLIMFLIIPYFFFYSFRQLSKGHSPRKKCKKHLVCQPDQSFKKEMNES